MKFKYEHETEPQALTIVFVGDEVGVALELLERIKNIYPKDVRDGIALQVARIEQLRKSHYDS